MFSREKTESKRVPMMPVRDLVIFPQMMNPFIVGRERSPGHRQKNIPRHAARRFR
jgi:hypothetical protein